MLKGWIRVLAILAFFVVLLTSGSVSSQVAPGKAELHPNFLVLEPSSPIDQGRLVNLSLLLENTGTATANAFRVEFFIRPRSTSTAASWVSFATDEIAGLASQEQQIEARAVLNTSLAELIPDTGLYEIRTVVDSNNQIPELDETNNEFITSVIVQASRLGLPDLRAKRVEFDPSSPVDQDVSVELTGTVINDGDQKAAPFMVELAYCSITTQVNPTTCPGEFTPFALITDTFLGGLPQGGELEARATLPALDPGTYLIRMRVDPSNAQAPAGMIEEQDEANNEIIVILAIQGAELHTSEINYAPLLPRAGETITVAATVENTGQIKASNAEVAFFVDGAQFDLKTVSLAGGQTEVVRGTLNTAQFNLDAGVHSIRIVVDPKNLISERDEMNNETRTGITLQTAVPRLPELRPKGILINPTSPIQLGLNMTITVSSEILNTGESTAGNVTVEFAYRTTGSVRWVPILCSTNCTISSLEPGGRFVASADLVLFGLNPGTFEVRALADPQNAVAELDEFNNELQSAFTLQANRRPDLLIDPFSVKFTPSLVERRGTPITITADAVNFGEADAGLFDVEISVARIAADGTTLESPVSVNRVSVERLSVGGKASFSATINTNTIRPGFYQVLIVVDPQNRVEELNEINNPFLTGPLFVRGPDLTGTPRFIVPTVNIFEPRISAGTELKLAVDVTNIGVEASGEFDVGFCRQAIVDNVEQGSCAAFGDTAHFPGLGVGSVVTVEGTLNTSGLATGRYAIKAVIDPTSPDRPFGRIEEENESNNAPGLTFEVVGTGTGGGSPGTGADLSVLALDVEPNNAFFGQNLSVRARIVNNGTVDADNFRVVLFYKRVDQLQMFSFAQFTVTRLRPGETASLAATLNTVLLGYGEFEIIAVVDFNNDVNESNENNNRTAKPLTVN